VLGRLGATSSWRRRCRGSTQRGPAGPGPGFSAIVNSLPFSYNGYRFERVIGFGGFSVVILVMSDRYAIPFAAKIVPKGSRCDSEQLLKLTHANIIRMYDVFESDDFVYLITEYCENGNLACLIESEALLRSRERLLSVMQQLTLSLLHCHERGVAHRDVKPSNVLIDRHGRPKLNDFGLSVQCEPGTLIASYSGSQPYRAPELVLQMPHDPFYADVWALGVTFYEMATGSRPWGTGDPKAMEVAILQGLFRIPVTVSRGMAKVITAMLAGEPAERPSLRKIIESGLFKSVLSKRRPSTMCTPGHHQCASLSIRRLGDGGAVSGRRKLGIASLQRVKPMALVKMAP